MPEKGWKNITVKEDTARRVKEIARSLGITVDELLNTFLSASETLLKKEIAKEIRLQKKAAEWAICKVCGTRVKLRNLDEHMWKVHPEY